jgi:hypothetical protein
MPCGEPRDDIRKRQRIANQGHVRGEFLAPDRVGARGQLLFEPIGAGFVRDGAGDAGTEFGLPGQVGKSAIGIEAGDGLGAGE